MPREFSKLHESTAPSEVEQLKRELAEARGTIEAFRAWHSRVDAFTSRMPILAFLKDDAGRYVYVNKAFEDVHGVKAIEILGSTTSVWATEELARVAEEQEQLVKRTNFESEVIETRLADTGPPRYFLTTRFPVVDALGNKFIGGLSSDVTAWVHAEQLLGRSEKRYRELVEFSGAFICTHDLEGRLLSVNKSAADSLGYTQREVVDRNLREFLSPRAASMFDDYLARIKMKGRDEGLFPIVAKDGSELIWQYRNSINANENPPTVIGYAIDVTQLKEAQQKLRVLSVTDELTGLHNRRGFATLAEHVMRQAKRRNEPVLLMYADIDNLKRVNDTLGHETGSMLIGDVAAVLRRAFRETDVIARIGGDEFAILVQGAAEGDAPTVIRRLNTTIDAFNETGGRLYTISLSVGCAGYDPYSGAKVDDILARADREMYAEKRRRGRSSS